jgi:hypothetical protein
MTVSPPANAGRPSRRAAHAHAQGRVTRVCVAAGALGGQAGGGFHAAARARARLAMGGSVIKW